MTISNSSLLIRRARILLPDGSFLSGDVLIQGSQIVQVAPDISPIADSDLTEIDASGLTLLPGVIDPQMPNTRPLTTTQAALDDKLRRASEKCLVNYGFFMGATAELLPDMLEAHPACGINGKLNTDVRGRALQFQ